MFDPQKREVSRRSQFCTIYLTTTCGNIYISGT